MNGRSAADRRRARSGTAFNIAGRIVPIPREAAAIDAPPNAASPRSDSMSQTPEPLRENISPTDFRRAVTRRISRPAVAGAIAALPGPLAATWCTKVGRVRAG